MITLKHISYSRRCQGLKETKQTNTDGRHRHPDTVMHSVSFFMCKSKLCLIAKPPWLNPPLDPPKQTNTDGRQRHPDISVAKGRWFCARPADCPRLQCETSRLHSNLTQIHKQISVYLSLSLYIYVYIYIYIYIHKCMLLLKCIYIYICICICICVCM